MCCCCCQDCCDVLCGSPLPQPGSTAGSWLEPQQPRVWDHSNSGAPKSLYVTIPRLPVGFPSFTVTAAGVHLGRCSLRKLSSSAAFTTHVPALKESGAAGAARAPSPGCQLCVCVVTTGMAPPSWTCFP